MGQKNFIPIALLLLTLTHPACTHTPPGTSVEIALAKRAELVRPPATPAPVVAPRPHSTQTAEAGTAAPIPQEKTELVADAFSRGEFCMKAGNDEAAIDAFREVVKLDPKFFQAWDNLATLYERAGNDKEAMAAFKHSKIARQ